MRRLEDRIEDIILGENWDVLGRFKTVDGLKKYLEVNCGLTEEEMISAIENFEFEPDKILVKACDNDKQIELYSTAIEWELNEFDNEVMSCCVKNFEELLKVFMVKHDKNIKIVNYSIDTIERNISDAEIMEYLEENENKLFHCGLNIHEGLLQLDGAYEWIQKEDCGFTFKGKLLI